MFRKRADAQGAGAEAADRRRQVEALERIATTLEGILARLQPAAEGGGEPTGSNRG